MKFICENCKAKYQIGDDKIAGRSVRMKCRRCGHLIQLSASVTEGSGISDHPTGDVTDGMLVETASSAALSVSSLLGMAMPMEEPGGEEPTRAMSRDERIALSETGAIGPATTPVRPAAVGAPAARPGARPPVGAPIATPLPPGAAAPGALRPGIGAPAPVGPSRPGIGAPAPVGPSRPGIGAPAPVGPSRPGVTGTPAPAGIGARPLAGAPGAASPLGVAARSAAVPVAGARPAPVAPQAPSGVAGTFQKTLAEGTAPSATPAVSGSHVPHGEDWYVGVGGVPLGPVRLAVIREKALAGAVHGDSLVWREGFDEWQPLKNFHELLEIVEEAQAARGGVRRPSATPPPRAVTPPPAAPKPPLGAPVTGKPAGTYQPKVTAIGVGIPAVTLPAGAKAPLGTPVVPGAPGPRPITPAPTAPFTPSPAAAPVPPAPAGSTLPSAARHSSPAEATRPSTPDLRPSDAALRALDVPAPAPFSTGPAPAPAPTPAGRASASELSATVVSPGGGRASSPDLFGFGAAPAAAPIAAAPIAAAPIAAPIAPVAAASALDVMRDPFAAPAAAPAPMPIAAPAPAAAPVPMAAPVPIVAPPSARGSAGPASEPPLSIEGLPRRRKAGMHPIVYAFIAMAAAFGGVVAYLMFSRPPPPVVIYQQVPGTAGSSPAGTTSAGSDTSQGTTAADVPSADPTATQQRVVSTGGTGKGPDPKATSTATSAPLDTSGFGGANVVGPTAVPTPTGPDPSLGQLSQGEIGGVVSSNQSRVRKRCWQPALDSAAKGAAPNARVKGHIVIGASGAVDSASASGSEKDYPGLSSCIAGQMKGWKFPPSSGSTPVDIPFVFAGQ